MSRKKSSYPSFSSVITIVILIAMFNCGLKFAGGFSGKNSAEKTVNDYALSNGLDLSDYPNELIKMLEDNEETLDFVLNYPKGILSGREKQIDLTEYQNCTQPPLLMQWDSRWGYEQYNGSIIGLNGSVPTCLSMTALYKLHDMSMNPAYIASFSKEHGWEASPDKLLSEGAKMLGLSVTEIPINDGRLKKAINSGSVVICTTKGKYFSPAFVIYGIDENGKYMINDPMSHSNSEKSLTFSEIQKYLKKLWAYDRVE